MVDTMVETQGIEKFTHKNGLFGKQSQLFLISTIQEDLHTLTFSTNYAKGGNQAVNVLEYDV